MRMENRRSLPMLVNVVALKHDSTELYTLTYGSPTETHVTDALNRVTKYFFDNTRVRNVVTRVEGNCGCGNSQISQWTYDNNLNVAAKTDALNRATTFTYDSNGNRLTQTDATGTITYTYNSLGDALTVTDQMSGVWTNTYDASGDLLTAKDPLNNQTTLTYDGSGQLLTVTDPRNNTTTFTYDTNGNLTRRTDALTVREEICPRVQRASFHTKLLLSDSRCLFTLCFRLTAGGCLAGGWCCLRRELLPETLAGASEIQTHPA